MRPRRSAPEHSRPSPPLDGLDPGPFTAGHRGLQPAAIHVAPFSGNGSLTAAGVEAAEAKLRRSAMFIATPIPETLKPQRGEMSSAHRAPAELADLWRRVAINITPLTGLRPCSIVPAKRANLNSRGCQPTEPSPRKRTSPEGAELLPHPHASRFGPSGPGACLPDHRGLAPTAIHVAPLSGSGKLTSASAGAASAPLEYA